MARARAYVVNFAGLPRKKPPGWKRMTSGPGGLLVLGRVNVACEVYVSHVGMEIVSSMIPSGGAPWAFERRLSA